MERLIEADLQRLKTETLTAFRLAQAAVDTAVRSVFERDPALADAVISGDAAIDAMECSLDAEVLRMLALHQPVAGDLRAIAARVPLDRVLIETDAPFLAPHPFRGQRNEPAYVRLVAERLAEVRGVSLAEIAAATTTNALELFQL